VVEHHALVTKFNLAVGYKALVASSLQVDQVSHHVAGSLVRGKLLILSAKEPPRIGAELVLGQLAGVRAQDVDVGSRVDICQADGVDGEQSSGHLASTRGRNPEDGHGILFGLLALVGNVGDMSATCRANTSMLANFPNIPFFADILSCQFGRSHMF
jgi:hypothetical protein